MSARQDAWESTEPDPVDIEWMDRAACRGAGTDLFFPGRGGTHEDATLAKRICAGCPVSEECLEYSLGTWQPVGIWGGVGLPERQRIRAKRRAA